MIIIPENFKADKTAFFKDNRASIERIYNELKGREDLNVGYMPQVYDDILKKYENNELKTLEARWNCISAEALLEQYHNGEEIRFY